MALSFPLDSLRISDMTSDIYIVQCICRSDLRQHIIEDFNCFIFEDHFRILVA